MFNILQYRFIFIRQQYLLGIKKTTVNTSLKFKIKIHGSKRISWEP